MRSKGLKKLVGVGLAGALFVGASAFATSAGAGEESATLTVTKTVVGTAPADAEFVINVFCESEGSNGTVPARVTRTQGGPVIVYDEDITFGPAGGEEDFTFFSAALCTITEIDDGGADSSTGPVEVFINDPEQFDAEIVNTFEPEPEPTPAPTTATTAAPAAAAAVAAAPAFTG